MPGKVNLVAVGASTGGVAALGRLLEQLPAWMPPIVITQHMPPTYTVRFAERLNDKLPHDVAEAREGETLKPGMVRIAPGDRHLKIATTGGGYMTRIEEGPPVSGHCPSVDALFSSVAQRPCASVVGVILTGMGRDGASGLLKMRQAGAYTLGQSERSCVVYGMPKAAQEAGSVCEEHDLERIACRLQEIVQKGGAPAKSAHSTA